MTNPTPDQNQDQLIYLQLLILAVFIRYSNGVTQQTESEASQNLIDTVSSFCNLWIINAFSAAISVSDVLWIQIRPIWLPLLPKRARERAVWRKRRRIG